MPCRQTGAGIFYIYIDGLAVDVTTPGVFLLSRLGEASNHTRKHIFSFSDTCDRPRHSRFGSAPGWSGGGRESLLSRVLRKISQQIACSSLEKSADSDSAFEVANEVVTTAT